MSTNKKGTFETTTDAFSSIEALVKDGRGNAIFMAPDRKRLHFGAGYLRLAAQKSAALADLIDGVANGNRNHVDKAKKRLVQIDRDIEKHVDAAGIDNERWAKENGAISVEMKYEDVQRLMKGEGSNELNAEIERLLKEKNVA